MSLDVVASPTASPTKHEHNTHPLDALLARDGLYGMSGAVAADLRLQHLRDAVAHHRNFNPHFDRYCSELKFDDKALDSEAGLLRVPLLPSGLFKWHRDKVRTGIDDGSMLETSSSGTQGTLSIVPRDNITLMRFFSSVAIGNREVLNVETFDRHVLNIGPSTKEARNLWIAYVMAGVSVIFTTRSYVREERFHIDELISDMRQFGSNDPVTLVGPPFLLLELANRIADSGRPMELGPETLVITIGGWKRREGDQVARPDFEGRIAGALGVPDLTRIRDAFNMVELNSVFFECSSKVKHCPPWVLATARDPRTLEALPSGTTGILAFLDPTPASYPGFILSDDFGSVKRMVECPCGIVGDTLHIERRVNRIEMRGCALKMETLAPTARANGNGLAGQK